MNKAELIVQGVLLELHYVVSEETFNRLVELVNNQLNAQQSVHPNAFGVFAAVFFFGFCCGAVAFNAI